MTEPSKTRRVLRIVLTVALLFLLIPAAVILCIRMGGRVYYAASVLIIFATMVPFLLSFERRRPQAREIVTIAVLCALAVASRAAFIAIPHFKPMVAIIMLTGIAFGPEAGFLTGAVSGFVSNFLFGQGPWTPWQMFAFGVAGFLAGGLYRLRILPRDRLSLALFGFVSVVLVIGPLLDTCTLFTVSAGVGGSSAAAVYLAGIPVNLIHGAATFLTMLLFSKPLLEKLDRLKLKYGMMED